MVSLLRTDINNVHYKNLVTFLDQELKIRDGEDHAFFAKYNKSDTIRHVVLGFMDREAVGCGAFKFFSPGIVEIKRMFVLPQFRGKGVASKILNDLEQWAMEEGFKECVLETGLKQHEAITLYGKCGYLQIPNYGQYATVATSVCMKKSL